MCPSGLAIDKLLFLSFDYAPIRARLAVHVGRRSSHRQVSILFSDHAHARALLAVRVVSRFSRRQVLSRLPFEDVTTHSRPAEHVVLGLATGKSR